LHHHCFDFGRLASLQVGVDFTFIIRMALCRAFDLYVMDRPREFDQTMSTMPNQDAAANRRPALQLDGSDNFFSDCCRRPGVSGGGRCIGSLDHHDHC
jgi:hypothetical protein